MLCRFEISQSFNHHPLLPVNPINLEKGIDQSIILQPTIVTSQSNQSCITSSRSIIWSPPTGNSRPNQSADTHCSCQFCMGLPILHRVANLHWLPTYTGSNCKLSVSISDECVGGVESIIGSIPSLRKHSSVSIQF